MHHMMLEIARLCQHVTLGMTSWHEPLRKMALLTGSSRAQLIGIGGPQVTPFNAVSSEDEESFADLVELGGYRPDINYRIAASIGRAEMEIVHEADYEAIKPLLSSDIYSDYCEQTGIPLGCQTKLFERDDRLIGLATLRTRREGVMTPEQRALFAEAATYIRGAVETQIQIERQGKALMLGALDAIAARAILIDGFGRVCGLTPAADRLITASNRLSIHDHRLASMTRQGSALLDRALAGILGESAPPQGIDIALPPTELDRLPLLMNFKSLEPLAGSLGIQPRAILVINGGLLSGDEPVLRLREAFDLTDAEAHVALALSKGRARIEIAIERGVSIDTLRSQIKSVFRKMGVGRESELVSLILGG